MKTKPTKMTRPERKSFFAAVMALAWATVAMWLVGSQAHSLVNTPTGTTMVAEESHRYGAPVFLTFKSTTVTQGNALVSRTETWRWHALSIAVIVTLLVMTAVACVFGYRKLIDCQRMAKHLCDECGYDLTGVISSNCPECGTQRTDGTV